MDKSACTTQKISFQIFCNEQKAKLQVKYPFLSKSQINHKIKELWKRMDITEKQCYTKTVLSPPKFKKNIQVKQRKKSQSIKDSTSMLATKGTKDSKGQVSPVLTQIQTDSHTESKGISHTENSEDSVDLTREPLNKSRCSTDIVKDVPTNQGRKTVPWKGRPSLGSADLWSDSSLPDSNKKKKAKSTKNQKGVQGILKPSGDAPRLKARNRVSFGSTKKELSSTLPPQTNSGDFNRANSDDDDNSVQLLCRTDDDMYDFEKIASYGLCVEEEDIYANQNRYIPNNWKQANVNDTTNESIQHSNEKNSEFKIPQNREMKKKKGAKQSKDRKDDGKLLSPLSEGSKNSPSAITTPQTEERQQRGFLITPQMNEVLVEQKLQEAKKTPKKNKAESPKSTSRTGSVRQTRGQGGLDPEKRKVPDEKQSSDTDSLSVAPLTESVSSGAESVVSPNVQQGVERYMNVLSEKLQRMHGTENVKDTIPEDDACLSERRDGKVMKNKSSYSMKNFALLPQKRRKGKKQKDHRSPSEVSESSKETKENVVKKPRRLPQEKKMKRNLERSSSSNEGRARAKRTKRQVEENKSPKPCKRTKKVKSPVGRMDADKLISESPNKIDNNSNTEEPSLYFTGDDSSSSGDDTPPTNKVLMTAILRMQRAVQCQEASDTEASSPCLSGISQLSSVVSERDGTTDAAIEKDSVNRLCEEIKESSSCSESEWSCTDSTKSQTPVQKPSHPKTGKGPESYECMDVPHGEKKNFSPIRDVHVEGDENVFQMFSKLSPAKAQNMQGRRYITSSEHEGRSNFKDLFQDNKIF